MFTLDTWAQRDDHRKRNRKNNLLRLSNLQSLCTGIINAR